MGRNYSEEEMKSILQQDVKIPAKVEQRIEETYRQIGAEKVMPIRYKKTRKLWKAVAAVAALTIGTSAIAVAANHFLSVQRVENGNDMVYEIAVDREREAHAVEVKPTYMPEGYAYQEAGANGGKWHNEETDGGITIMTYNAAELDWISRIGENLEFLNYKKDTKLKEIAVGNQKADVYTSEQFYMDSEDAVKKLYMFNEEYGYGIWIWMESTLDAEELVKIAEGLEVTVLDEVVPYATEAQVKEELAAKKVADEQLNKWYGRTISADEVHAIGEEVSDPMYAKHENEEGFDDIRFTVKSAEIRDSLSLEEFPAENFMTYEDIEPWFNTDGTLKPHDRIAEGSKADAQSVNTKFLVVTMNARNASDTQSQYNAESGVVLTPDLTTLTPDGEGNYRPQSEFYRSCNKEYNLQYESSDGSSFPIYFDRQYYTEGIQKQKSAHFRPLEAGESLDYTLIYVVDEDQIENMCLWFYAGCVDPKVPQTYVAVGENVAK